VVVAVGAEVERARVFLLPYDGDAREYWRLVRRIDFLEDALSHQKEVNREMATEQGEAVQRITDLESGMAEQARLLVEARSDGKLLEARVVTLETQLGNVVYWLKKGHEEGR
jgi:hypothetical protein